MIKGPHSHVTPGGSLLPLIGCL